MPGWTVGRAAACVASSAPRATHDAAPWAADPATWPSPCRFESSCVPALLEVDLGGVGLREAAQTRGGIISAVDVLQCDGPVLGGVEELLLRGELDPRLADDGLESLEVADLVGRDLLEGGVEHRLSHRIGILTALYGLVHRVLAGGPLDEQPGSYLVARVRAHRPAPRPQVGPVVAVGSGGSGVPREIACLLTRARF